MGKVFNFLFKKYWSLGCLVLVLLFFLAGPPLFRLWTRLLDAEAAERLSLAVRDGRLRAWADERFQEYRGRHPDPGDATEEFFEIGQNNAITGMTANYPSRENREDLFFVERKKDFGWLWGGSVNRHEINLWFRGNGGYNSLMIFSRDCPEEIVKKSCECNQGTGERVYPIGENIIWSGRRYRG